MVRGRRNAVDGASIFSADFDYFRGVICRCRIDFDADAASFDISLFLYRGFDASMEFLFSSDASRRHNIIAIGPIISSTFLGAVASLIFHYLWPPFDYADAFFVGCR